MNWTGGQLRRHSARKGILSKTQRKNFAKSRQLVTDRPSHQVISFPSFLDLRGKKTETERETLAAADAAQDSQETPLLNTSHGTSHGHRFLQSSDWAAVSLSCPLDIKFTPAEEVEQFGKRRKLNEADHKRLSTQAGRITQGLFQSRINARRRSPERDTSSLNRIQIHIDGRLACPHPDSDVSPEIIPSRGSSQSMLPGHHVAAMNPSPSAQACEQKKSRDQWQNIGAYNPSPNKLTEVPRTPSTIPETVILQNAQFVTPSRVAAHPPPFHTLNHPIVSSCRYARHTNTLPTPTNPLPRHLTVDEAVLSEQIYPNIDCDTDQQTISRSPSLVSTLVAFPNMNETQISANQIPSRGMFQPREINDRVTNDPFYATNDTGSSQGVRVFGQLVRLNTEAEVDPLH
ncbi:hypothetical protein PENSTE_c029G03782 [Penicillium steckii]|uniref:Uncharacterized protein n=1 Tax=Penicillium steckii TaxID=303698 RepID=A0A1V6SMT2_9EURO|nr:hypothetical protein PENSTE_c029G03782 [Penicillium steckii]